MHCDADFDVLWLPNLTLEFVEMGNRKGGNPLDSCRLLSCGGQSTRGSRYYLRASFSS